MSSKELTGILSYADYFYAWDRVWEFLSNQPNENVKTQSDGVADNEELKNSQLTKELDNYILKIKKKVEISDINGIKGKEEKSLYKTLLFLFLEKLEKGDKKDNVSDSLSDDSLSDDFLFDILNEEKLCDKINSLTKNKLKLNLKEGCIKNSFKFLVHNMEKEGQQGDEFPDLKKLLDESKNKFEGGVYYYQGEMAIDYVFFDKMLILKSQNSEKEYFDLLTEALASRYRKATMFGIARSNIKYFSEKKELSENNGKKKKTEILDKIQLCLVFKFLNPDNAYNPDNASGHTSIYEILQNVNDHSDGNVDITVNNKFIEFSYKEKERKIKVDDDVKVKGMRGFDIFALTTLGNSVSKSVSGATGEKGTGFKSVYDDFEKVEVDSYGYRFTLDNSIQISDEKLELLDYDKENLIYKENKITGGYGSIYKDIQTEEGEPTISNRQYPLLIYGENSESPKKTVFRYFLKKENIEKENFFAPFFEWKNLLFLNFEISEEFLDEKIKNQLKIWKNKKKEIKRINDLLKPLPIPTELDITKNYTQILFIKEVLKNDQNQKGKFYCTLPLDGMETDFPVYINLPLLKLIDNRKEIDRDSGNLTLLKALFYKENAASYYVQVLNEYIKDLYEKKENIDSAYRFIPKPYYCNDNFSKFSVIDGYDSYKEKFKEQLKYCNVFECYECNKENEKWERKLSNINDMYLFSNDEIYNLIAEDNECFFNALKRWRISKILAHNEKITDIQKEFEQYIKKYNTAAEVCAMSLWFFKLCLSNKVDKTNDHVEKIRDFIEKSEKISKISLYYLYLFEYHCLEKEIFHQNLINEINTKNSIDSLKFEELFENKEILNQDYVYFKEDVIKTKIKENKNDFSEVVEYFNKQITKGKQAVNILEDEDFKQFLDLLKIRRDIDIFLDEALFKDIKSKLSEEKLSELFEELAKVYNTNKLKEDSDKLNLCWKIFKQIPFECQDKSLVTLEKVKENHPIVFILKDGILKDFNFNEYQNIFPESSFYVQILQECYKNEFPKDAIFENCFFLDKDNQVLKTLEALKACNNPLLKCLYFDLRCHILDESLKSPLEAQSEYFFSSYLESKYNKLFLGGSLQLCATDSNLIKSYDDNLELERVRKRLVEGDYDKEYYDKEYNAKKKYYLKDFLSFSDETQKEVNHIYIYNGKKEEDFSVWNEKDKKRKVKFSYIFAKKGKEDIVILSDKGKLKKFLKDFGVFYHSMEKIQSIPVLLEQKTVDKSHGLFDFLYKDRKKAWEKKEEMEKEQTNKKDDALLLTADYYLESKNIFLPGYANICPICNSRIVTQLSGIKLPWVVIKFKNENTYKIRLCSCSNCKDAIEHSIEVNIKKSIKCNKKKRYEEFDDEYDFLAYMKRDNTEIVIELSLLLGSGEVLNEIFEFTPSLVHRLEMYRAVYWKDVKNE